MDKKELKHRYLQSFGLAVIVLALTRCFFPGIASHKSFVEALPGDSLPNHPLPAATPVATELTTKYVMPGEASHPILSVTDYATVFPDSNHVQLQAANRWGVSPVKNRKDAEARKGEVVFMGYSPYYSVAKLDASIPYLVPRAAILLEDIGRSFYDSLQVKGLPLHEIVVSSVLRSEADVAVLRRSNRNATEQSCHLYGTTFDINYNVYIPLTKQSISNDKLKYILSEVLNDMRQQGRCYIKYEQRQPCFHITVR